MVHSCTWIRGNPLRVRMVRCSNGCKESVCYGKDDGKQSICKAHEQE
jgi:hypothetical protein